MKINNNQLNSFALLPKEALKYLHIASLADLRVLIMLIAMEDGQGIEPKTLNHFNITEGEFNASLAFWQERDILPKDIVEKGQIAPPERDFTKLPTYNVGDVAKKMDDDETVQWLLLEGEKILGKTLTNTEITTIYGIYDWLKLPPPVIIMLMNFCGMQNKKNIKYIEKTAIEWSKQNISTLVEADKYIAAFKKKKDFTFRLRGILQITERELTPKEKAFVAKWEESGISDELITLAYEKTVANTGKVAFAYMDKIIDSWAEKGITDSKQVDGEKRSKVAAKNPSRFDFEEYRKRSFEIIKGQEGEN